MAEYLHTTCAHPPVDLNLWVTVQMPHPVQVLWDSSAAALGNEDKNVLCTCLGSLTTQDTSTTASL